MGSHIRTSHEHQLLDNSLSTFLSWSAVQRMGIKTCPLCSSCGPEDSPELIDHVLRHTYEFAFQALPWSQPAAHDWNLSLGIFNPLENPEKAGVRQIVKGQSSDDSGVELASYSTKDSSVSALTNLHDHASQPSAVSRITRLEGDPWASKLAPGVTKTAHPPRGGPFDGRDQNTAIDALKNLSANVPVWIKKLDELANLIEERQTKLANLAAENKETSSARSSATKSVRSTGSTESLNLRNGLEEHLYNPTIHNRQRTDSVVNATIAKSTTLKLPTHSMTPVYYDNYVQMFFEELVKFVSSSRNLICKAKMAAKITKIKRLAELESPDQSGPDSTSPPLSKDAPITAAPISADSSHADTKPLPYPTTHSAGEASPLVQRVTRGLHAYVGPKAASLLTIRPAALPDVYDELDKGLKYVQSMCEQAAHQFLRGGDCSEAVANIKRQLGMTKETADKELARVAAAGSQDSTPPGLMSM